MSRRAVVVLVGLIGLTVTNVVYDQAVHPHPSRPLEVQQSARFSELVATSGNVGVRTRAELFIDLHRLSEGGEVITGPDLWFEWQPLSVLAGLELVIDETHDPTIDGDLAARLLEMPHEEGRHRPYWPGRGPPAPSPYVVVHPPDPSAPVRFLVLEHEGVQLFVAERTLDELDARGGG